MGAIISPITGKERCLIKESISTNKVIDEYKTILDIDISKIIDRDTEIQVYECLESGYEFYYPFHLSGDSGFYEQLQKFSWYYNPWKWEHKVAFDLIESNSTVLEIGCAEGSFVKELSTKASYVKGIELNQSAVNKALEQNLNVENKFVDELLETETGKYDYICCFQVLEHVSDVNSFLNDIIQLLKPNGKLIISVPNNDSLIVKSYAGILNQPPHHMGLWKESSIKRIQDFFSVNFKSIYFEPLKREHYHSFIEGKIINSFPFFKKFVSKLILKLFSFNFIGKAVYSG